MHRKMQSGYKLEACLVSAPQLGKFYETELEFELEFVLVKNFTVRLPGLTCRDSAWTVRHSD